MGTDIYIITELARTDLLDYIRFNGALRETLCRRLFFDLASGVEYMHSINLVHRDIKWYQARPKNIGNLFLVRTALLATMEF